MMNHEWWDAWCAMWRCVAWRGLAKQAPRTEIDMLDVCATLMFRITILELREKRSFLGMFW